MKGWYYVNRNRVWAMIGIAYTLGYVTRMLVGPVCGN